MCKRLFLAGLLLAGSVPAFAACDQQWRELMANAALDADAKAASWEALAGECGEDAAFDHRLALVYSESGRFDEAERVIRAAIAENDDPDVLVILEYDLIDIERSRVFASGKAEPMLLRNVLSLYLQHTEKYPQHALGFSGTAGLYLLLDEPENALVYSQKAITLEADYLALRTLAIALVRLDEYQLAIDSAVSASQLNSAFARDIDLMMSVAYAYINVNDVTNAKAALGALLRARPEVRGQAQFDRLVAFVYRRAEELEGASDG